jgi:hypothetical protein
MTLNTVRWQTNDSEKINSYSGGALLRKAEQQYKVYVANWI